MVGWVHTLTWELLCLLKAVRQVTQYVLGVVVFHCIPCDSGVYTMALVFESSQSNKLAAWVKYSLNIFTICYMKWCKNLTDTHLHTTLSFRRWLLPPGYMTTVRKDSGYVLSASWAHHMISSVSAYLRASSFFHCGGMVNFWAVPLHRQQILGSSSGRFGCGWNATMYTRNNGFEDSKLAYVPPLSPLMTEHLEGLVC